jgi:formylmethanofuran:tetrahydromethanopterin formyltransferase
LAGAVSAGDALTLGKAEACAAAVDGAGTPAGVEAAGAGSAASFAPVGAGVVCVFAAGKNSDGLPEWRCQASHKNTSEVRKIIHKSVRRKSVMVIGLSKAKR